MTKNQRGMTRAAALAAVVGMCAGASQAEWRSPTDDASFQAECFRPWSDTTATWMHEGKDGPYRIAVVNSFTGNTWRIQMLKTLLAFAETPEIAANIEELKVISTGTDVSAQIAAMEDFINQGYDAVIANAMSTEGFDRVIRAGERAESIVMTFDNVLGTDKLMQLSSDNHEFGRIQGEFLIDKMGTSGKVLEVRGLPGISVDLDRHDGLRAILDQYETSRSLKLLATGTMGQPKRWWPTRLQRTAHLTALPCKLAAPGLFKPC